MMGYEIYLDHETLLNSKACHEGQQFLDWLDGADEFRIEVTPLAELLMAIYYPEITEWLRCKRILRRPVFTGHDFTGIKFNRAFLRRACFNDCSMFRCDLSGADLRGASFCNTNLTEANLIGVNLDRVVVSNVIRPEQWGDWYEKNGVLVR